MKIPSVNLSRFVVSLFSILVFPFGYANATERLILESDMPGNKVGRYAEFFEDKTRDITIEEITSSYASKFEPVNDDNIGFGFSYSAYWIRVSVENPTMNSIKWILVTQHQLLDYIEVYEPVSNGTYKLHVGGDRMEFDKREINYSKNAFKINSPTGKSDIYVKIYGETFGMFNCTMFSYSPDQFHGEIQSENILFGVYYGAILIMLVYNFFVYLSLRDISYLHYILYLSGVLLWSASFHGHGFQYFWPRSIFLANYSTFICVAVYFVFASMFATSFLHLKTYSKMIYISLSVYLIIFVTSLSILILKTNFLYAAYISYINGIILPLFLTFLGFLRLKGGFRPARYYVVAWSLYCLGFFILLTRDLNILPISFITIYSIQLGTLFDIMFLAFALADRINILREEKDSAMNELEEYSRKLVEAQEIERKRIAAELHDSVGQDILLINNMIRNHMSQKSNMTAERDFLNKTSEKVMDTLDEIRSISADLRPPQLDQLGLEKTLNALFEKVSDHTNLVIDSEISLDGYKIPKNQEINVFRIIQEALNNVIKHSSATTCLVSIMPEENKLAINITDNGDGFVVDEGATKSGGYGIAGMRERTKILGGAIDFESVIGEGTRLTVSFPAQNQILGQ